MISIHQVIMLVWFLPLVGSLISGLLGPQIGHKRCHEVTIGCVGVSMLLSLYLGWVFLVNLHPATQVIAYTWMKNNAYQLQVGFYLDPLSVVMLLVVSFVSLLVHIYSIGYMRGEAGYNRFFAYVSLFTFAMYALVGANNLAQLFFGWEGVGVVSYLLIGFYFKKPSAVDGALKAFLVNRVGDLGLMLAIALCYQLFHSLDYQTILSSLQNVATTSFMLTSHYGVHAISLACFLFLIGAMGKSAQIPLHVWLPESMEGPTPISALIHAATMVTAGIYLICRLSPMFELAPGILNVILVVGSLGALLLGLVGIVQNDIKRVVAYSTLSQLGYMIAATGASAYSAAMFHLMTHACFKALLFLAAGSVIVALHHEQDMRKMGGLAKSMPITYVCNLIGILALVACPFFSGFYSKDSIIAAVGMSKLPAAPFAHTCLMLGAMVTAIYAFRSLFMTYHGKKHYHGEVHDPDHTITIPLMILAIPSLLLGFILVLPIFKGHLFGASLSMSPLAEGIQRELAHEFASPIMSALGACLQPTFYLTLIGFLGTYVCYMAYPNWWQNNRHLFKRIIWVLEQKWWFDWINEHLIVPAVKKTAGLSYRITDQNLIDGKMVMGSSQLIYQLGRQIRRLQSGLLYQQAFSITLGLIILMFLVTI